MELLPLQGIAVPSPIFTRRNWHTNLRASVAALVLATICLSGCSTETTQEVVAKIAAQIPLAQTIVTTAAATAEGVDPAAATLITAAADTTQAGLVQLQILCGLYTQSPNPTILAAIGDALNTLLNTNASALLDAAHITNPTSRDIAQASIGALQTALLLLSAILQKSQSATQLAATAASRNYKLRDLAPYLDHQQIQQATGLSFNTALRYEESQGF